jgi:2-iminobutanoate/2-iminopropanoate deaminase
VKRAVSSDQSPLPGGPYSQGLAAGAFVFVSGQGPVDPATSRTADGIAEQTHQTLRNVRAILAAGGCGLDDVIKVTVHLADLADFSAFNEVYRQYFSEPFPVRTTVGSRLIHGLVEIDAIAVGPSGG